MKWKIQKQVHCCRELGKILRTVFHFSFCIYLQNWIGTGTGSPVLVQPVSDRPVVIACCGLVRQVKCWFLHSSFIHSFTHSFLLYTCCTACPEVDLHLPHSCFFPYSSRGVSTQRLPPIIIGILSKTCGNVALEQILSTIYSAIKYCPWNSNSGSNCKQILSRISFLAMQVIFIYVYITNYLHFFTMFLSL